MTVGSLARLGLVLCSGLLAVGCGKPAANTAGDVTPVFPSIYPEAPALLEATAPAWTSGHAIAATDDEVFVVDRDNGALVLLDRGTLDVVRSIPVGARPEQIVVGPTGEAWVTVRRSHLLVRVSPGASAPDLEVALAGEPLGIAMSDAGDRLFVGLFGARELVVLDATTGDSLDGAPVSGLPRGLAVLGDRVIVTRQTQGPETYRLLGGELGAIDPAVGELRVGTPADVAFDPARLAGLHATRVVAVAPDPSGDRSYVAHIQAQPGQPDALLELVEPAEGSDTASGGGYGAPSEPVNVLATGPFDFSPPARPVEPMITTVRADGASLTGGSQLPVQDPETGESMVGRIDQPSDIAHHPTWSLLFVTGEGTDNVLVLNSAVLDPMTAPLALIDVGRAPRGVAFSPDGSRAYVLNGHDFDVSEVDLTPLFEMQPTPQRELPSGIDGIATFQEVEAAAAGYVLPVNLAHDRVASFGTDPAPEAIRRGRRVFMHAGNERLSHGGRFACATCHLEGGEDKLVWVVTDGLRQTPALAGRLAGTAPFNWAGGKADLQSNMIQTIERMGGQGLDAQELADLEQFLLDGLEAPTNPNLADTLTAEQLLGKSLFFDEAVGCGGCHVGGTLSDGELHDVDTAADVERDLQMVLFERGDVDDWQVRFNTPSLQGLWYTAPYLHDGSAPTLEDVLSRTATTMGKTDHLSPHERDALVAYLLTL